MNLLDSVTARAIPSRVSTTTIQQGNHASVVLGEHGEERQAVFGDEEAIRRGDH
jgi:hypothetical protein